MENLKIIEEKENELFNRKEIKANIEADITPTKSDIKKIISRKFSTQPENIKLNKIKGSFGSNNFKIIANIYNSKKDKDKTEPDLKEEKITEPQKETKAGTEALEKVTESVETSEPIDENQ